MSTTLPNTFQMRARPLRLVSDAIAAGHTDPFAIAQATGLDPYQCGRILAALKPVKPEYIPSPSSYEPRERPGQCSDEEIHLAINLAERTKSLPHSTIRTVDIRKALERMTGDTFTDNYVYRRARNYMRGLSFQEDDPQPRPGRRSAMNEDQFEQLYQWYIQQSPAPKIDDIANQIKAITLQSVSGPTVYRYKRSLEERVAARGGA